MRLWHINLLPYLPEKQLLSQWRECVCIARSLALKGTPGHVLVNRILDYPSSHFFCYCLAVQNFMTVRGYRISRSSSEKFTAYFDKWCMERKDTPQDCDGDRVFPGWHNDRYLMQCYRNLQEKYDCHAVTEYEWMTVIRGMAVILGEDLI